MKDKYGKSQIEILFNEDGERIYVTEAVNLLKKRLREILDAPKNTSLKKLSLDSEIHNDNSIYDKEELQNLEELRELAIQFQKDFRKYSEISHQCDSCAIDQFFSCSKTKEDISDNKSFKKYDEYEEGITKGLQTVSKYNDGKYYYNRFRVLDCKKRKL